MDWNETHFLLKLVDNCMDRRAKLVKRVLQKFKLDKKTNIQNFILSVLAILGMLENKKNPIDVFR
jgi:hypothetical protein